MMPGTGGNLLPYWTASLLCLCLGAVCTSLASGAALSREELLGEPPQVGDVELYNPLNELPMSSAWLTQFNPEMQPLQKRRPISVNQDLMSISRMMGGGASRGRAEQAQSFLSLIGKRAGPDDEEFEAAGFVPQHQPSQYHPSRSDFFRTLRNGHLSVGMPLRTLSGMLQAQRRRQFVDRANNAHSRLMGIGKRSVHDLLDSNMQPYDGPQLS